MCSPSFLCGGGANIVSQAVRLWQITSTRKGLPTVHERPTSIETTRLCEASHTRFRKTTLGSAGTQPSRSLPFIKFVDTSKAYLRAGIYDTYATQLRLTTPRFPLDQKRQPITMRLFNLRLRTHPKNRVLKLETEVRATV